MRPTPEEIIDGLEHSLEQEIRPELSSEWGLRVADAMTWALRHLKARWLRERDVVVAEQDELAEILRRTRGRDDLTGIDWTALDEEVDDTHQLSVLIAHNLRLRTILDSVIEGLPSQSIDAGNETWSDILTYLQNQIDREESLLYPPRKSPKGPGG